jgi:hypothetical protein
MKYFIGFLAIIILVVGVFIVVLRGFTGGPEQKQKPALVDYANSSTVVMKFTVTGPVTADPKHTGYRITVGRDSSTIEVTQGYEDTVIKAQTYGNNSNAYADFLRAIDLQNYTRGNDDKDKADFRGVCPNGSRYTYEIEDAGKTVQRYWNGSCGGGTFQGRGNIVRGLFNRQIPDFNSFTAGLNLGTT